MVWYTRRVAMFDGSSGQSSTYTSSAVLVGDYDNLSVSWHTDTATGSRLTLEGSNDDGFTAAITNWSVMTGITVADQATATGGVYTVDPGIRWMRAARNSNESLSIVNLQLGA